MTEGRVTMSMTLTPFSPQQQTDEADLQQIKAEFESHVRDTAAGSSRSGNESDGLSAAGSGAAAGVDGNQSSNLSANDTQNLLNGDYYSSQPQKSTATCPPNVSMDQLMEADGGLLKNMGNQQLTGSGAQGISGGLKDNLAKLAGGKPGDIGTNKDVTMRALMILQSTKNTPSSDGKMLDASTRHNGNLSGLNPSGEADNGSEVGYLQNLFKDPNYTLPKERGTSDHMNSDDTEKSGGQLFMQDVGKYLLPVLAAPLLAIPGVGEAVEGAAVAADVGVDAGVAAGEAAGEAGADAGASAAGDAAGDVASAGAGNAAGGTGSSSAAQQLMQQMAMQTAKEGAKEGAKAGWNQIQNQYGLPNPLGAAGADNQR